MTNEPVTGAGAQSEAADREPSGEQIVSALRRSGWLLEQDTQTRLSAAGYHVYPGAAFPDPDEPSVSREIDVMAFREVLRDDALRLDVGIRILAECKQSATPYVLVGRRPKLIDRRISRKESTFRHASVVVGRETADGGVTRTRGVATHHYLGLDSVPGSPWADTFVATQMTRLERRGGSWNAGNEGIFTSLVYPLAKAGSHFDGLLRKRIGSYIDHDPKRGDWASIEFRFPVVVTSASIYKLDVETEPLEPALVGWATMSRDITTSTISGTFRIDVVNYESLDEYLSERVGNLADALSRFSPAQFLTREDLTWPEEHPDYWDG